MTVDLRPIQQDAIARVRAAFGSGKRAVCMQAVTGYGKTVVAAHIAEAARARGNRVLFLAHQDILIRQMSRKLDDFGARHGTIMSGVSPNVAERIQVASVQTMVRRIQKFRYEFELIIIDEAHRSIARSYTDVLKAIPTARVLGITGTPSRLDGRGLGIQAGGIFDHLITTESVGDMIRLGYLVQPIYYASAKQLDLSHIKSRAGEYDEKMLTSLVDTPVITGSAVEHYREHLMGQPVLTWCVNIEHAEHTAAQFNDAGVPTVVLTGRNTTEERDKYLGQLSRREVLNICFAQLLVEGVDVPAVRGLIMLRPSQSETAYLQVCGRGLRVDPADPSKKTCIILDHAGLAFHHGLCDETREWSLDGREKKNKSRGPMLIQCKSCFLVFSASAVMDNQCPSCGAPINISRERVGPEHVDGKLEQITPELAAQIAARRKREVKSARTLEELQRIGSERGYSPNWATIQYSMKQRARERAKERWGLEYQTGYNK